MWVFCEEPDKSKKMVSFADCKYQMDQKLEKKLSLILHEQAMNRLFQTQQEEDIPNWNEAACYCTPVQERLLNLPLHPQMNDSL